MITNYENLRQTINQLIQNSGIDVGVLYFIFKDYVNQFEKMYYAQLNKESIQQAQSHIQEQELQNQDNNINKVNEAEENK